MAEIKPDMEVLTFEKTKGSDERLTYADLVVKGGRLAALLKSSGIKPGEAFALVLENGPEIILSLYAALVTGTVMVPLDPLSSPEKLAYLLRDCRAKGVILPESENSGEKDIRVLARVCTGELRRGGSGSGVGLDRAISSFAGKECLPEKQSLDLPAMILYTSGTTGVPKGVQFQSRHLSGWLHAAAPVFGYGCRDRLYTGLPLTHGNPYFVTILPALVFGLPAVVSRYFDTRDVWQSCRHYGCTSFSLLGGLASEIFNSSETPFDKEHPVKKVISAGMPSHIWKPFERRFNVTVHEWYGTLEGAFAHNPPGAGPTGSFGKPLDGYTEMKVANETGGQCRPEEVGELLFRSVRKNGARYLGGAGAPIAGEGDGWVKSGDMVHQDKDGWFFYDYRKGQGIRRYGEFISAGDVESILLHHPEVREVCIYGVDSFSRTPGEQEVVMAVVPQRGVTPDIRGLFNYCTARLPAAAVPSFIQLVDQVPKTRTQKVIRRLLVEEFDKQNPNIYEHDYLIDEGGPDDITVREKAVFK